MFCSDKAQRPCSHQCLKVGGITNVAMYVASAMSHAFHDGNIFEHAHITHRIIKWSTM